MAKLIYSAITSLDGYLNDETGGFEWAAPDEEVHAFVNDLERDIGTYLYGRRMYETMLVWETMDMTGESAAMVDYANIWRAADKVVYSGSLASVSTSRTRLESSFDPDAVRAMKSASESDLSIGGAHLGAEALRAGLVDELHLFLHPVLVGGGTAALPDGLKQSLELIDERRFGCGVVHVHYRVLERLGADA
jgi:dihydrofolate reductase